MALESRLELKLSQKLVLTPQLQMAIRLLQMPQLELSQTITQELTENPFLEELPEEAAFEDLPQEEKESETEPAEEYDDTEKPLEHLAYSPISEYFEERGADGRDLGYFTEGTEIKPGFEYYQSAEADRFDHLLWQLRLSNAPEDVRTVAAILIGNIDENGYLRMTDEELAETASCDIETARSAVALVQGFDPAGIAARDIAECLLLQLNALGTPDPLAAALVRNSLELVGRKKYHELARMHNTTPEEIMRAVKVIEGLDPKPGRNLVPNQANYIIPDVYIIKADGEYQIVLNDEGMPKLRINSYYQRLLSRKHEVDKDERQFLEEKLRSAVWLIKSLDQRNRTIYRVTECILRFQRDFFEKGVNTLRPLNLKDVASELNLHESTISRVTSNKYLSCPRGTYGFKYFFSNAIPSESGELSSTTVKEMIRRIVSEEDASNPLSDMKIVDIFKNQNITIARRTIAKYREELKIPSQSQRRRH
ncbi:MAG: RNA polymerase factor sigma-54 [Thermodesulfovibrionales bacterium]